MMGKGLRLLPCPAGRRNRHDERDVRAEVKPGAKFSPELRDEA